MPVFQIVLLALLQGLTEFLPISSSAHLIFPNQLLGWADQGLAFDVAVHVGSLAAVVIYFRQDIITMFFAWVESLKTRTQTQDSILAWAVIVGTIPAVIVGLFLNDIIELYLRSILVIAITTIFFGILLAVAEKVAVQTKDEYSLKISDALYIGMFQCLALIPGTSRSGITMTAGLFKGFSKTASARFSFLLSIPLILAAGSLKGLELMQTGTTERLTDVAIGTVLSGVTAYICIHFFLKWLEKIGFMPFVIYRLLLGVLLLAVYFAA